MVLFRLLEQIAIVCFKVLHFRYRDKHIAPVITYFVLNVSFFVSRIRITENSSKAVMSFKTQKFVR